jgi:hypothetical protein
MKTKFLYIGIYLWALSCVFYAIGDCQNADSTQIDYDLLHNLTISINQREFVAPLIGIEYGPPIGLSFSSRFFYAITKVEGYNVVHYVSFFINPGLKGYRFGLGYMILAVGHSLVSLELRASIIRTARNPIKAGPYETYGGPEIRIGGGGFICIGYYVRMNKPSLNRRAYYAIQYGVGI